MFQRISGAALLASLFLSASSQIPAQAADAAMANVQAAVRESLPLRIPDDLVRDAAKKPVEAVS